MFSNVHKLFDKFFKDIDALFEEEFKEIKIDSMTDETAIKECETEERDYATGMVTKTTKTKITYFKRTK